MKTLMINMSYPFYVTKNMKAGGRHYSSGEVFDTTGLPARKVETLVKSRKIRQDFNTPLEDQLQRIRGDINVVQSDIEPGAESVEDTLKTLTLDYELPGLPTEFIIQDTTVDTTNATPEQKDTPKKGTKKATKTRSKKRSTAKKSSGKKRGRPKKKDS